MKIVVFGGCGFLGRYISEELISRGHSVTVFDRQITKFNESIEYIQGDILDSELVEDIIRGSAIVYNLAAISDIEECVQKPLQAVNYNVIGNMIIMKACLNNKVDRFVFSSSVYAYNDIGGIYSSTKKASENFIKDFHRYYGLKYSILQYGTLYGIGAPKENSIHKYLNSVLVDKKINYIGDGTEIREYVHVSDASRLSVDILDKDYENKTLIITGHNPTNVKDLFRLIEEIVGESIDVQYNTASEMSKRKSHYKFTPYSMNKNAPCKLTSNQYIDLGIGILNLLEHLKELQSGNNSSNTL